MTQPQLLVPGDLELLHRQRQALQRLLELTGTLAHQVHLDQTLESITQLACQALDCERATLYQYDPDRQELVSRAATELEIPEIRHRLGEGISGYVAQTRQVLHVPDVHRDPRWSDQVDRRTGFQTRCVLAAPIVSPRGQLLGVLQVLNKRGCSFEPFDEQLITAFCQHAATALERAQMIQEMRRQEAVQASLEVARTVQRSFMPKQLPRLPGYELVYWWYPHQHVGGDYLDIIPLSEEKTLLVMADVSGHGLGPALLMASVRAALRALVTQHHRPDELLMLLNRSLAADLQDGRFVTMVLAVLDVRTNQVEFANAGHGPALHYRAAEDRFDVLEATGLPLGVMEDVPYETGPPCHMAPGDLLLLCTDGIVEARNTQGEEFKLAGLKQLIRQTAPQGVRAVVDRIAERMRDYFVDEQPQDDLTVLALGRLADAAGGP